MGRVNRGQAIYFIFLAVLLGVFISTSLGLAQEDRDKKDLRPERGIAVYTEYSGVTVPRGESVKMDLILEDKGRTDEVIDVKVSTIPNGWRATLKGGSYLVGGLYVANGKTKNLSMELEPDKSMSTGAYVFQFDAKTEDGKFTASYKLTVNVQ